MFVAGKIYFQLQNKTGLHFHIDKEQNIKFNYEKKKYKRLMGSTDTLVKGSPFLLLESLGPWCEEGISFEFSLQVYKIFRLKEKEVNLLILLDNSFFHSAFQEIEF